MTTVAQCHLPTRPIAVGNRQKTCRLVLRRGALQLDASLVISTFSSLAGSFGSQLVVGNYQHLAARFRITARLFAAQRFFPHLNEYPLAKRRPPSGGHRFARATSRRRSTYRNATPFGVIQRND